MTATLKAIYKKGVLRLSQPIALPEGACVTITLTDEEAPTPPRYPAAIEALYRDLITKVESQ